jgi:hypothetical protein
MAAGIDQHMPASLTGERLAESVGGPCLTWRGYIVFGSFHGHERGCADRGKVDLVAAKSELLPGKIPIMEDTADIFQVVLRRKIHLRQRERSKRKAKGIFAVVGEKLPEQFSTLHQMPREIAGKDRELERLWVNEPPLTRPSRRHLRDDPLAPPSACAPIRPDRPNQDQGTRRFIMLVRGEKRGCRKGGYHGLARICMELSSIIWAQPRGRHR